MDHSPTDNIKTHFKKHVWNDRNANFVSSEDKNYFLASELVKNKMSKCDIIIRLPAYRVDRIQEMHIAIGHIICEMIEKKFK